MPSYLSGSPKMASSKTKAWNLGCRSGNFENKMNWYSVSSALTMLSDSDVEGGSEEFHDSTTVRFCKEQGSGCLLETPRGWTPRLSWANKEGWSR
ncbi:unnamed protein product [Clonostachys solani]|uniref:Uncharacterized protein n=1 Tax=Clonostachys solani TaxID=160281 RepID=A0A9N9VYK1_9HYPO|nr:unnamed protein product [Clonostachys solani]